MDDLFQAWVNGFLLVFSMPSFAIMCLAIVIGFVVGIIPFVSVPMTLALMLPFTFEMKPHEAFAFLVATLSVAIIFSDITSIIFGVPGEPVTASTLLDGHPMAKQGQTGRALGAVLMSSLVGSIIGALLMMAAIPLVRPIVLAFGAPEFFGLALLGVLAIAILSRGNVTKGVISGAIGLLWATIGLDPQAGIQRYTFGQLELWDGLSLVPVTVGLFGVAELTDLWIKQRSIAEFRVGKIGGVMEGIKDTFRYSGLTIRCSLLGSFLGIIPGLGGTVGQWLAYAHSVQSAKDKSRFGKGDVRGVIGPGATMNAKEGGNLLTTVAFGIPSSVSMAILLGAFLIHGVVPGPSMLTKDLDLTMTFVWVNIVSHLISVGLCFLLLNQMVKITHIRSTLLVPVVLMLALLGGFADKNADFDMVACVAAGFVGMIMVRLNWPRPPLILGMVLGPLVEKNLFISYSRYEFSFLLRPVLVGIILVGLAIVVIPYARPWLLKRLAMRDAVAGGLEGGDEVPEAGGQFSPGSAEGQGQQVAPRADFVLRLVVLAMIAWMVWEARGWPTRASLFPLTIGIPGLALAVLQTGFATRRLLAWRRERAVQSEAVPMGDVGHRAFVEEGDAGGALVLAPAMGGVLGGASAAELGIAADVARRRTIEMSAWILAFTAGILLLGFRVASFLLPLAFFKLAGRERWRLALPIAFGTYLVFVLLFGYSLNVPFPNGLLADALNIESPDAYVTAPLLRAISGLHH
jgi:TctA family transporter